MFLLVCDLKQRRPLGFDRLPENKAKLSKPFNILHLDNGKQGRKRKCLAIPGYSEDSTGVGEFVRPLFHKKGRGGGVGLTQVFMIDGLTFLREENLGWDCLSHPCFS